MNSSTWTVWPISCDVKAIERTLKKNDFLSHSKLYIPTKNDNAQQFYYHPYVANYRLLQGWMSFETREKVHHDDYLTHDHLHLFLALMTRNYRSQNWKKCAFVTWDLSVLCKQAAPLQERLQSQEFLSFEEKNKIEAAVKKVIMWRNQQPPMTEIKFIFFQHNINKLHYTLYIIVNPWVVH